MRTTITLGLLTTLILGCGDDGGGAGPDAPAAPPPPRVISGGGIGDGPIDGVANVYVIADASRQPVMGATVRVGEVEGTTDADGLFVATGVTGPQTVVVKASGFRAELWVGANGANMTFNLGPGADPVAASAMVSGTIDLTGLTVPAGHTRIAVVTYSQTDDLGDPENEIATAGDTHVCFTGVLNDQPCAFTVATRTGTVALIASVYDRDLNGTPGNPNDDTQTLVGWAHRGGIAVGAGATLTGMDLGLIDNTMTAVVTVDFGTPPAGHPERAALTHIDAGADGMLPLQFVTAAAPTLLAPMLAAFPSSTYRLIGLAASNTTPTASQSIVLRRGLTGTSLAAGTWLTPPTSTMATRTGASWGPVVGATVHSVEYTQGTANLLNVTTLDGTTQITIPELIALPTSGALTAQISGIGAPGLDVGDFELDRDRDKLVMVAAQPVEID